MPPIRFRVEECMMISEEKKIENLLNKVEDLSLRLFHLEGLQIITRSA